MMECGEKVKHAFVVSYAWKNRRKESIPSNNSKYTEEFSEQTAKLIIETEKSATSISEEMELDKNTVCRWVRDYRRKHGMPTYAEEKGFVKQSPKEPAELKHRIRELEAINQTSLRLKYSSVLFHLVAQVFVSISGSNVGWHLAHIFIDIYNMVSAFGKETYN